MTAEFETPTPEQIVKISGKHVALMETSDADDTWIWVGMEHLLLRTIGRRSGNEHKVALPFWRDGGGHRVVVASFGGAPTDPAWFLNLSDRGANPEVLVRVQGGLFWSDQQILDGAASCLGFERTCRSLVATCQGRHTETETGCNAWPVTLIRSTTTASVETALRSRAAKPSTMRVSSYLVRLKRRSTTSCSRRRNG